MVEEIGGGGCSIHCSSLFVQEQEAVDGFFQLKTPSGNRKISFRGTVIYILQLNQTTYRAGIEFGEMKSLSKSDIIKFCKFKQLASRNKLKNYVIR